MGHFQESIGIFGPPEAARRCPSGSDHRHPTACIMKPELVKSDSTIFQNTSIRTWGSGAIAYFHRIAQRVRGFQRTLQLPLNLTHLSFHSSDLYTLRVIRTSNYNEKIMCVFHFPYLRTCSFPPLPSHRLPTPVNPVPSSLRKPTPGCVKPSAESSLPFRFLE